MKIDLTEDEKQTLTLIVIREQASVNNDYSKVKAGASKESLGYLCYQLKEILHQLTQED